MTEELRNKVVLEWAYTPSDYFEAHIQEHTDEYLLEINEGRIRAILDISQYEVSQDIGKKIQTDLNNRCLGIQALTHKPYTLSDYSVCVYKENGARDIHIRVHDCISISTITGAVDLIITNADGKIVADTKAQRIAAKQRVAELAQKFANDRTALAILEYYGNAVRDSNRELVHLYDIRDALSKRFGSKERARKALRISGGDWSDLGHLANDEPLKQGRHIGKHVDELRDATQEELNKARRIACTFILKYLEWLETSERGS